MSSVRVLAEVEASSGTTFTFELNPTDIPDAYAYVQAWFHGMAAKRIAYCPTEENE